MSDHAPNAEYGNYPLLKRAFRGMRGDPILIPESENYFVIGNFQTIHDESLGKVFNNATGISYDNFHAIFKNFAKENGLRTVYSADDMVILLGRHSVFEKLKAENGQKFSYARTDQKGYQQLIEAEEDYQQEHAKPQSVSPAFLA